MTILRGWNISFTDLSLSSSFSKPSCVFIFIVHVEQFNQGGVSKMLLMVECVLSSHCYQWVSFYEIRALITSSSQRFSMWIICMLLSFLEFWYRKKKSRWFWTRWSILMRSLAWRITAPKLIAFAHHLIHQTLTTPPGRLPAAERFISWKRISWSRIVIEISSYRAFDARS